MIFFLINYKQVPKVYIYLFLCTSSKNQTGIANLISSPPLFPSQKKLYKNPRGQRSVNAVSLLKYTIQFTKLTVALFILIIIIIITSWMHFFQPTFFSFFKKTLPMSANLTIMIIWSSSTSCALVNHTEGLVVFFIKIYTKKKPIWKKCKTGGVHILIPGLIYVLMNPLLCPSSPSFQFNFFLSFKLHVLLSQTVVCNL